jgi:hypothetical protein
VTQSAIPNPFGTAGEPAVSGVATGGTAATAAPAAVTAPAAPPTGTPTPLNIDITQIRDPQTRAVIQGLLEQQSGYTGQLQAAADAYRNAYARLQAMSSDDINYRYAVTNLDSAMATWTTAQNNIIRGQDSIATTIQHAIDAKALEPQWQSLADKYTADAAEARQRTSAAEAAAPAQRGLLVAQATSAQANAALANAQAANLQATSAATIANLQASANQSNASAANLLSQSGLTAAQTQKALVDLGVEPRSAEATAGTLEANRAIAERNLANMPTAEQAGRATEAAIATSQAGAAQAAANVGRTVLGPTFGLQQQMDAIKQIADSMRQGNIPLGTDPSSAIQHMNDQLNRYLQATIGGTTIAEASKAAQTAQENLLQQQVTQRQQEATLQGQGLSSAASAFGSAISPLIGAVKDLPAGSTALGPAAAAMFAPFLAAARGGLVQPPAQIAPPALPPFLQNFLAPKPAAAPQTSAPVTINIGGGGGPPGLGVSPAATSPTLAAPAAPQPNFAAQSINDVSRGMGGGLPSFLQGSQLTSGAHVDSLWANDPNLHPQGAMG